MLGHDVAVFIGRDGGDILIGEADLTGEEGLNTAVFLSLLSDARHEGRGGWCLEDPRDPWGSRLWTLQRASVTTDTLKLAKQYTLEALQWMIEDKIAETITVSTEWGPDSILGISIVIQNSGVLRWKNLWDAVAEQEPVTFGGALLIALQFDGQVGETEYAL
jgi:phage gp46-like protein